MLLGSILDELRLTLGIEGPSQGRTSTRLATTSVEAQGAAVLYLNHPDPKNRSRTQEVNRLCRRAPAVDDRAPAIEALVTHSLLYRLLSA